MKSCVKQNEAQRGLAEPLVWLIMVVPLVIKIFRMPVLKKAA